MLLDGAMGTELQKRGMPAGECPELWCSRNEDVLEAVHGRYREAGAEVIYTATFGANRCKLGQYGISDAGDINRRLARTAKKAAGRNILVAGDIGPTGRFVRPFGDLGFDEALSIFREQVRGLVEGGVDLFVIETMMDIQEARAALIAVKETADIFTIVTMTYEESGRTLNGTDPVSALITLQSLGADAVGCNCSTGPEEMVSLIAAMKPYATVPLVAKPNAGIPRLEGNESVFTMGPDRFAAFAAPLVDAGVNLVGGCCGTTPDHVEKLRHALAGLKPRPPERTSLSAVSSAAGHVIFDREEPLMIIGERINPTGKKDLQEELREGRTGLVQSMARRQEGEGARLLDVNVGLPGIDEKRTMEEVLSVLSVTTALPLVIDSPRVETVEQALKVYPGRALINSISGEREKMERLLPVAARYGAMFILLPLVGGGVPATAAERIEIIRSVYEAARQLGFTRDDIIVDGLVMTVSSHARGPRETLKTIEWCSRASRFRSVIGLSNVSFGMPERKWLNASFLSMAVDRGLTMAIANPGSEEVMNAAGASSVLSGNDRDAAAYLGRFAPPGGAGKTQRVRRKTPGTGDDLFNAVLEGNRDDVEPILARLLQDGSGAASLLDTFMIPAITEVGERYERKEYFLPQLIASAETMKRGVAYLRPFLKDEKAVAEKRGTVLLATVEGDIHDIGKNIVALILENHGFKVADLGKDVPARAIVDEAKRIRPDIIGLSALMTTTMVHMKDVIDLARKEGLTCEFLVGGAVVSPAFAGSIGAHYAKDGVEAVRVAGGVAVRPE